MVSCGARRWHTNWGNQKSFIIALVLIIIRRVTRKKSLIQNLEKKFPNFGKNAPIAFIYGLNLSFKMRFLRGSTRKNHNFLLAEPFFFVL